MSTSTFRLKLIRLTWTDFLLFYVFQYCWVEEEIHQSGYFRLRKQEEKKERQCMLSYHLELEPATNNFQINCQIHNDSSQAPVTIENFFKFKTHLTGAICKIGNFYPIKLPIPLRIITLSQIVLPQQYFKTWCFSLILCFEWPGTTKRNWWFFLYYCMTKA